MELSNNHAALRVTNHDSATVVSIAVHGETHVCHYILTEEERVDLALAVLPAEGVPIQSVASAMAKNSGPKRLIQQARAGLVAAIIRRGEMDGS